MKIKEDLEDILNDHKSNLIELSEDVNGGEILAKDIEIEHDRMLTEVN